MRLHVRFVWRAAVFLFVFALNIAAARAQESVVISEFVANSDGSYLDEDGLPSDWIEIYNAGNAAVDLAGWHLTDDSGDLTKWTFPSTNIPPFGFLLVFATGKEQSIPGLPLHSGFALNTSGSYLGLIHPDGTTIASEFAPVYPRQHSGFSYGIPQSVQITALVGTNATLKYVIPTGSSLASDWAQPSFNDTSWKPGTNGVGYEQTAPGWAVHVYKSIQTVDTISAAETLIGTPNLQSAVYSETAPFIDYLNSGSGAHYPNDRPVPGFETFDADDYVIEGTGYVTIPSAGSWTFGVSSDDGFKLTVGSFIDICDCLRGAGDTLQTFNFPAAGDYPIRLEFFERGGGSEVEVFAIKGAATSWNTGFHLVGDTANGGLAVRSQPLSGKGGGYAGLIQTDVQASMLTKASSAYLRIPFSVANTNSLTSLILSVRYDDGFVAYLNGTEVARRNADDPLAWNSAASADHYGGAPEIVYLANRVDLLRNGQNLLAVQALNVSASDSDFLIQAELDDLKTSAASTNYQYFSVATPGAPNSQTPAPGFVGDVHFSVPRGFYDAPFSLAITCDTTNASIYYTTNGSAPSESNGFLYSGPLPISVTTPIRARGFNASEFPSAIATVTYLFPLDVIRQPEKVAPSADWPAPRARGTGSQTWDYGMDQNVVNSAGVSSTIVTDLKSLPTFSVVIDQYDFSDPFYGFYANPYGDTIAWERPCSLELINPDGSKGFQIDCGIRTRGGYSRSPDNPKHGLRVFFRSDYGEGSLKYPLLKRQNGTDVFQKFDIRTFQNYSWSFDGDTRFTGLRDTFSRDTQLAMGQQGTRGDYYQLYINGQYWGIYNIDERAEANFGETYYGGSSTNYDTIKVSPDDGYVIYATDGNMDAWTRLWMQATNGFTSNANYFKVQGLNPDGTPNPAYENLIDVDNLIDYMLVILYGGNLDAPISNFLGNTSPNNFFALRDRSGTNGGFRFTAHDSEHTLLDAAANRIGPYPAGNPSNGGLYKSNPQYFWQQMWPNPEFKIKVADHAQKHFFNNGALVASNVIGRLNVRSNMIYQAINAESARWGNANHSPALSRTDWLNTMRFIYSSFVPNRANTVLGQLRSKSLFPTLSAPSINQFGGAVPGGFEVTLTNLNATGTIYYTLDGSDPRALGGAVSTNATEYVAGASIPLFFQTRIRARVLSGTNWSAQIDPYFYPAQDYSKFVVTEVMYNPPAFGLIDGDKLEFLEFKNTSATPLELSGAHFTSGINFAFPAGTRVAPGAFFVIARDPVSFSSKYPGVSVQGKYSGKLSNQGDTLTLVDALGQQIFSFVYNNTGQWPVTANGLGFSLVPKASGLDLNEPNAWRASAVAGGSPGADDPQPATGGVVINEILSNSPLPQTDSVELFNPTAQPVDISYWSLTDDTTTPLKFRIPQGTVLGPGEYRVFTEADFNTAPGTPGNFALSSTGDEVYLFAADSSGKLTGYSHGFKFDGAPEGVTIGRLLTSVGAERFELQIHPTLGATNSGPVIGPVVINRIMYHPFDYAQTNNKVDEFVELLNISGSPVTLYDSAIPTNTWRLRGSVNFNFPQGVTLQPSGTLILANTDSSNVTALAAFRARYSITAPVYGPYSGALPNDLGSVEILKPGSPVSNTVPYIRVDRIDYESTAPWPSLVNGTGRALQRITPTAYGNDPTNWKATGPLTVWVPPADAAARPNANLTFTVFATSDSPLTFQWQHAGTNLLSDGHYAGVTASNLVLTSLQPTMGGPYTVQVSDGGTTVTSGPATLTVLINPSFVVQPFSQTIVQGDTLVLKAQVLDNATLPLTYVWQRQTIPFLTNVTTSFSDSLTVTNVRTNVNLRVTVKNPSIPSGITSSTAIITVLADSDGDHIPDVWETSVGLNPQDASDALVDSDGDGVNNLLEFRAGTDPHDAQSFFHMTVSLSDVTAVGLTLAGITNHTYTIQFRDSLDSGSWSNLISIPAPATNGPIQFADPGASSLTPRYYRAVTPALQ